MTVAADALEPLTRALDQMGALVDAVRPAQATLPTPCAGWDVRTLVNHVVGDLQQFRGLAKGGRYERRDDDLIGDDWSAAYGDAARALLETWSEAGALEGTITLPFGEVPATWRVEQLIVEMVVHGWDISRSTGQSIDLDPELARRALAWGAENLKPEYRGGAGAFGHEVPVSAEAPAYDRVAGFFGRDPGWSASS
jgi:uncharacterized protein (TIGR03086 family)